MNKFRLLLISLAALFVGGLRDTFATANATPKQSADAQVADEQPPDPNSEVGLLIKGAGVDYKDVLWRIRAGLTPKQAVEVAAAEKREASGEKPASPVPPDPNSPTDESAVADADLDDMKLPALRALAKKRNVDTKGLKSAADFRAAIKAAPAA